MFGSTLDQHAHWSTYRELAKAGLFSEQGLFLGKKYLHLLHQNGPEHALVVASTQSGKTSCFVIPNLLTWDQSLLIHDPKEELHAATAGWRATFSRVVQLAPTSSASHCFNPLDGIRLGTDHEIRDAQLIAECLTDPDAQGSDKRSSGSQHFVEMGAEAISGLILYGLYTQRARSLGALNVYVTKEGFKPILKAMRVYPHFGIQRAAAVLTEIGGGEEVGSIFSTATRTLRLYTDPLVARMTDRSDFTLRDLRERARPMSLYLSIPFGDQERLRGWTRLVIRQLLDYAVHKKEGWPWKLLGMIDEVPGLRRFNMLTDGLNYFAGYGVRLALITPSLEELIGTYTTHHNFLEGCKIKIAFGQEDAKVAEVFSQRVGMTEVRRTRQMGRQRVTELVKEPLLSATALTSLGRNKQLIIVGEHKMIARKMHYTRNPLWRRRSHVCG